jgi:hypothetical protein
MGGGSFSTGLCTLFGGVCFNALGSLLCSFAGTVAAGGTAVAAAGT